MTTLLLHLFLGLCFSLAGAIVGYIYGERVAQRANAALIRFVDRLHHYVHRS